MSSAARVAMPILIALNRALRRLSATTHRAQALAAGALGRGSSWYDHHIDVYWKWERNAHWGPLARGVFSGFAIREGARVLEVGSGDGFFARSFYASRAREVVGIELDSRALAHARRVNRAPNVSFERGDLRFGLPDGPFDNVVWDAGINYLAPSDAASTLREIRARLGPGGLLSGYTDRDPEPARGEQHVFADGGELARFLHQVFPHVCVLEYSEGARQVFQFYAAVEESSIPISRTHPGIVWLGSERGPEDGSDILAAR